MNFRSKTGLGILVLCLAHSLSSFSQVRKIFFNPKAPGTAKQSNFVDSIRFHPLELRDEKNQMLTTNLSVTSKYFLLTDYSNKILTIYDMAGKFIGKVNYRKLGESFYPSVDEKKNKVVFNGNNKNYSLTQRDMIKIRTDWSNPSNKKYFKKYEIDLADPELKIVSVPPTENDINQSYQLDSDLYFQSRINTSPIYKDSVNYELKTYRNGKPVGKYFPYNQVNEPKFLFTQEYTSVVITDTPKVYLVTRPYCDTIYRMTGDSLTPYLQVVLPMENAIPASFYTKPFKNKTERENFQGNNGWMIRQVYNIVETPSLYYFTVSYQTNYEAYVYQKKGNATYKAKSVKADSSQYNLQLLADLNIIRKNGRIYKLQKAGTLLDFFEKHPGVPVPKELEAYLKAKPNPEAPIIVEYKLKTS